MGIEGVLMNLWDVVIVVIVVVAVALAVGKVIRDRKNGRCACGGDCGSCACGCDRKRK